VLIDATDKSHPILLATIENDAESEYVHTATLDGTRLFLNPANWLGYPQQHFHVPVYDVSNPLAPERLAFIEFPAPSVAHDTFVDHRPDGRTLLYSASIHTTDIFDITDVGESTRLQTSAWPEIQLSHQAEPSFDRKLVVVGDEAVSSFSTNPPSVCGRVEDRTLANVDVGSIHFFVASPDGTMADQGTYEIGSFNIPPTVVDGVCSAHVFWQAPDERRLSAAWYSAGARIVDFGNPAAARELGWFIPEPQAMYWSVKPHCGYLFATDLDRGLDILRYTGEGGRRWPATSGPAEVERAQHQGAPAPAAKCRLR
jgi:hypothetical protein